MSWSGPDRRRARQCSRPEHPKRDGEWSIRAGFYLGFIVGGLSMFVLMLVGR